MDFSLSSANASTQAFTAGIFLILLAVVYLNILPERMTKGLNFDYFRLGALLNIVPVLIANDFFFTSILIGFFSFLTGLHLIEKDRGFGLFFVLVYTSTVLLVSFQFMQSTESMFLDKVLAFSLMLSMFVLPIIYKEFNGGIVSLFSSYILGNAATLVFAYQFVKLDFLTLSFSIILLLTIFNGRFFKKIKEKLNTQVKELS